MCFLSSLTRILIVYYKNCLYRINVYVSSMLIVHYVDFVDAYVGYH